MLCEHFESCSPYHRLPLSDQVEELAEGNPEISQRALAAVHPLSWCASGWHWLYATHKPVLPWQQIRAGT